MKEKILPELLSKRRYTSGRRWIYCMVLLLCTTLSAMAQDALKRKVSVSFKNESLARCLEIIQQRGGITFFYNPAEVNVTTKKYTAGFDNKPVTEVVNYLLQGTGLEFEAADEKKIVIRKMKPRTEEKQPRKWRTITGEVRDAKKNTPVAGAEILIQSNGNHITADAAGKFAAEVKDTVDVLVVYFVGYATKMVKVGNSTSLSIKISQDSKTLGGVTVEARRRTNTEASLLNDRKNAATISDGISAQNIEKTASITTTQALQRVSGVTITDEKYVAIRGLGDRSVIGQLNGVRLASSDPDRSAIPLDLIPASLLDNITVYKSSTPDKPADASAGIVELKTKSIPEYETFNITIQSGFNTQVGLGGRVNSFYNADAGFFGQHIKSKGLSREFQDLATQYPNGLRDIQSKIANSRNDPAMLAEANRINGIMHQFDPVLTTKYKPAPLNQIYSITYGNNFKAFKKHQVGLIIGGNYYSRVTDTYGGELSQWSIYQGVLTGSKDVYSPRIIPNYITPNNIHLGKYLTYKENTGVQTLNYGFLGGLTYRFNPQHEISMQYLGSRGAETRASNLFGAYEYTGLPGTVSNIIYSLKQSYRTLNTFNLQGEHKFMKGEYSPRLSYNLATSSSTQDDPDYRFVNLADYKPVGGGAVWKPDGNGNNSESPIYAPHLYSLVSGYVNGYGPYGIIQADPNGRRFRKLHETNYNYKADVTVPFKVLGLRQEFKTGVNYLHRKRDFAENVLFLPGSNYSANKALPLYEVNGNLDRLVGYDRIGIRPASSFNQEGQPRTGGFLYNIQKSPNNYKGFYETRAFYGMLDLRLTENLRLTGGARFELTDIQAAVDTAGVFLDATITTPDKDGNKVNLVYTEPNSVYKTDYKPYYSAGLTYTLHKNMNFRLGYSNSLARPELRELTNVFDFDPFQFALVVGNPKLKNQLTTNYDFRWEWFPAPGEVLSASVFYKEIDNQLTKVYKQQTSGLDAKFPEFPAIEFQNDPNRGRVYGIELEVVKNLGLLWKPLQHFFLGSNLLLAQSEIKKTAERMTASQALDRRAPSNSPLFEQAPYSVNVFLNYNRPKSGTDITATFNMVGERLIQVNLDGTPDLYTRPNPVLDIVFGQRIVKRLLLKGYAKNILDQPLKEVYANPNTGGKYYGKEYIRRSYKRGTEIMLGLSYTL
ncbi:TonB-dependent receptor domain-containing protein [Chitinophaga solisilvae]|uniref:TonB-dependent receptor domain-containing protein n=1 Tax=Chitinophaga solisilvae TaxID=1233460 RepID=UPI001924FC54|nr:TonB-dependent receptor [Chitinophaga solisilvae]